MIRFLIPIIFGAGLAQAQAYEIRPSDTVLDADAFAQLVLGRELEFFDGGMSRYSPGGSYSWTYSAANGGGNWFGTHAFDQTGAVCIEFRTLRSRCDLFVQDDQRLVLLTEDGQRYPVREIR
ncbi:hypothetical protein [Yoonia sp. BS5-3]|uniref:Dihydrodipicolinate reductase n=1 Tax=Yoonia phaeophyticola TaxID=3137369 RepID=A0ABZ2V7H9_9RHOB